MGTYHVRITAPAGGSIRNPVKVAINIRGKKVLGVVLEIPAGWQDPSGAYGLPYQTFLRIWVGTYQLLPNISSPGTEGNYIALDDFHNYVPTPYTLPTRTDIDATVWAYTTDIGNAHSADVTIFTDEQ
jgi:hypothetical protein